MSGIRESLDVAGYRLLHRALERSATCQASGYLQIAGRPGGVFLLARGLVLAVESPGAPGPETLLARSGRITDGERAGGRLMPGGRIGVAELHVIRLMAAVDATFAILAGQLTDCVLHCSTEMEAGRGEDPERLLHEARRRLDALASLPDAVLPHRERFVRGTGTEGRAHDEPPVRKEILQLSDGRRCARDIAFLTGRSVYAVTVEVSRMLGEGLLEHLVAEPAPRLPSTSAPLRPRVPLPPALAAHSPATGPLGPSGPPPAPGGPAASAWPLAPAGPVASPGPPGLTDSATPGGSAASARPDGLTASPAGSDGLTASAGPEGPSGSAGPAASAGLAEPSASAGPPGRSAPTSATGPGTPAEPTSSEGAASDELPRRRRDAGNSEENEEKDGTGVHWRDFLRLRGRPGGFDG